MITNRTLVIMALILAFGLYFSGSKLAKAVRYFHNFDQYVEVKGSEERTVKSDLASWQLSFTTSADDLVKLYQDVSDAQKTVKRFLVDAGFSEAEIESAPISVFDNKTDAYQYNASSARYKASAGISLVTKNVDLTAQASQKTLQLLQQGVVLTGNYLKYSYTSLNDIKADMLKAATQNARESAMSFSKVAKADVGSIRRAHQGLFTITSAGVSEYDDSSMMKKVRVVTTVQFFLH